MRKPVGPSASHRTDFGKCRSWSRRLTKFTFICAAGAFCLATSAGARPQQAQAASQSQSSLSNQPQVKSSSNATPVKAAPAKSPVPAKPLTLAEAARLARAQHANEKSAHVYSNDDVANNTGTISVVGNGSSAEMAQPGKAAVPSANGGGSGQQEQYWRSKAQAIKDQIASIDRRIADEKAEISKGGAVGFDPSTGLAQNVIIIHDRNADIKNLEGRKADLEKQLDDLADSVRRAGGDPGWVR